jgi:hypothetical protein
LGAVDHFLHGSRAREARRHKRKQGSLYRPPVKLVTEESDSKERLRVSNWIVQGLYDYAVNEAFERRLLTVF